MIKSIKPEVIKLKNRSTDELGFQNLKSDGYEPSYNCYRKGNKLIINIEAPGDSYLKTEFQRNGAFTFIRTIGKKIKIWSQVQMKIFLIQEKVENLCSIFL